MEGQNSKILDDWERAWDVQRTERRPVMAEYENGGRAVSDELKRKPRAEFCSHTDLLLLSPPAL